MSSAPARTGVRVRKPAAVVGILGVLFCVPVLGAAGPAAAASAMKAAGSLGSVPFAVLTRAGAALEPLSFVSARSAAVPPFSGAEAVRSARSARVAQPAIVASAPGGVSNASRPARKRVSLATLGWAVLAVVVLAAAVATPLLLRRHRNRQDFPP
jgi:hypothetical protein